MRERINFFDEKIADNKSYLLLTNTLINNIVKFFIFIRGITADFRIEDKNLLYFEFMHVTTPGEDI